MRDSYDLSLGLINLLEQLRELGGIGLLDYWFRMKGCDSGTARWRRCADGGGASTPSPGGSTCISVFTNLEVLRTLSSWFFMEVSLHSRDWSNHWPLVTDSPSDPLPSPEVWGWGVGYWKFQPSNHTLAPFATSPCPYLINITKDAFTTLNT